MVCKNIRHNIRIQILGRTSLFEWCHYISGNDHIQRNKKTPNIAEAESSYTAAVNHLSAHLYQEISGLFPIKEDEEQFPEQLHSR